MAAESWRNLFFAFKDVFWEYSSRRLPLTGSSQIQRKTKNPVFITFLGLKTVVVLKADETCNDIRWYRSRFLQTLISCNLSAKVYSLEIHAKMAIFWLVFLSEKPSEIR